MGLSIWQLAIVAILIILLFGRGKLSGLMTDLADGIKSFRTSMKDETLDATAQSQLTDSPDPQAAQSATSGSIPTAASKAE